MIIVILMKNKLPLFNIQQDYTLLDVNADEMHISLRQSVTACSVKRNMWPALREQRWMRNVAGGTGVRETNWNPREAVCPSSLCSDLSAEAEIIFLFPNSQRELSDPERAGDVSPRRFVAKWVSDVEWCVPRVSTSLNELVRVRRPCPPDALVMDEPRGRWAVKKKKKKGGGGGGVVALKGEITSSIKKKKKHCPE